MTLDGVRTGSDERAAHRRLAGWRMGSIRLAVLSLLAAALTVASPMDAAVAAQQDRASARISLVVPYRAQRTEAEPVRAETEPRIVDLGTLCVAVGRQGGTRIQVLRDVGVTTPGEVQLALRGPDSPRSPPGALYQNRRLGCSAGPGVRLKALDAAPETASLQTGVYVIRIEAE